MLNGIHVVTYKQHRAAFRAYVFHLPETFCLKLRIADSQNLVNDKNLGLKMRGHGKCQAHVHPAAVPLHGSVEKPFDLGKIDNGIEFPSDLLIAHPQD